MLRHVADLRLGGLFETALTHRKGKIVRKSEYDVKVEWKNSSRHREFTAKGGVRVSIPTHRTQVISGLTEVL